jgi:hypothetical protein
VPVPWPVNVSVNWLVVVPVESVVVTFQTSPLGLAVKVPVSVVPARVNV